VVHAVVAVVDVVEGVVADAEVRLLFMTVNRFSLY